MVIGSRNQNFAWLKSGNLSGALYFLFLLFAGACRVDGNKTVIKPSSVRSAPNIALAGAISSPHPWCVDQTNPAVKLVITDSLGPINPTLTRSKIVAVCPTIKDSVWEGQEGDKVMGTFVRLNGIEVGTIEWTDAGNFSRLLVSSPQVVTIHRLGVGSLMSDIRRAYPLISAGYDEYGVYVWPQTDSSRVSYLLRWDASAAMNSPDDISKHVETIPDSAKVRTLILSKSD